MLKEKGDSLLLVIAFVAFVILAVYILSQDASLVGQFDYWRKLMSFEEELEELESAEDFLNYFQLDYSPSVVHVNRLHILQRFHDYLQQAADGMPEDETPKRAVYSKLLLRAYQDFVESDAQTEKVFKVFAMGEPQSAFVALTDIKT